MQSLGQCSFNFYVFFQNLGPPQFSKIEVKTFSALLKQVFFSFYLMVLSEKTCYPSSTLVDSNIFKIISFKTASLDLHSISKISETLNITSFSILTNCHYTYIFLLYYVYMQWQIAYIYMLYFKKLNISSSKFIKQIPEGNDVSLENIS